MVGGGTSQFVSVVVEVVSVASQRNRLSVVEDSVKKKMA
jgi:hypothetical protein